MSLVVTGGPGVGKHTVAGRLARMHGLDLVDLNEVAAESGIIDGGGGAGGGGGAATIKVAETHDVDVAELERAVAGRITGKTLVVGHLAPYVLERDRVRLAIVLRRSPYELESVYKSRGYSESKVVENQGAEILGVVAFDAAKRFGAGRTVQIDVTGRTVEEVVVAAAVDKAAGGPDTVRQGGGDAVDWLSLVSSNGDMGRFFPTS